MDIISTNLSEEVPAGCGCPACQNGTGPYLVQDFDGSVGDLPDFGSPTDTGPIPGVPSNGKPIASAETYANFLTSGYWYGADRSIDISDPVKFSISNEFSASDKAGIRLAFDLWADVSGLEFTEVSSGADISLIEGDDGRAWSNGPTISIDTNVNGFNNFSDIGWYGLQTVVHEIGHSIGLGHSGHYNGSATYANDATWANDSHRFSVMSYFSDTNTGADHWDSNGQWQYGAGPALYDIYAAQQLYGADYSTRAGNTTYGFNSNAGNAIFDFTQNNQAPIAIWDGAGNDTLDFSGYSTNQTIYLTEGDFSSVGYMTYNVVIAYGATIENAIGGSGNDTIYGNDAANTLTGNAGNDYFYGSLGSDTVIGGTNSGSGDSVDYSFAFNEFLVFVNEAIITLQNTVRGFTDTIREVENFIFDGVSYTLEQLSAFDASEQDKLSLRLNWGGGEYRYNSEAIETTFITAEEMGQGGQSGNQFKVVRDATSYTLVVQDADAANVVKLFGTDGNDNIVVQGTHNSGIAKHIEGGDGNDIINSVTIGDDILLGGAGNDQIWAGEGNDVVIGGVGTDTLNGGAGNDHLLGGDDADTLNGGADGDRLEGENGDDVINGDGGDDKLFGQAGDDTINGGDGVDYIYGGADNDTIDGGADNDFIYGGDGADNMSGGTGVDKLFGENGNDTINGGDQNDLLVGGAGQDTLNGDDGNDHLNGGTEADILNGGAGNDRLEGGDGADTLIGGAGADLMFGGTGNDVFGFTVLDGVRDVVKDFNYNGGVGDQLNITDILSGFDIVTDDINDFVVFFARDANTSVLKVNADGVGNDFVNVGIFAGSNMNGVSAQDLLDNGTLITNQTLV